MNAELRKPSRKEAFTGTWWHPEKLRRVDVAAAVAGLNRSEFLRQSAERMADRVLQGEAQDA